MKKQRKPIKLELRTENGQTIVCDGVTGRKIENVRSAQIKYDVDNRDIPIIYLEIFPLNCIFKQK